MFRSFPRWLYAIGAFGVDQIQCMRKATDFTSPILVPLAHLISSSQLGRISRNVWNFEKGAGSGSRYLAIYLTSVPRFFESGRCTLGEARALVIASPAKFQNSCADNLL